MSFLDLFHSNKNNKKLINVLDRLLQISIDGENIEKNRKIDMDLYKILNTWKVNQEAIHMGLYPIVAANKTVSKEFVKFIDNLWVYIEYDINHDWIWAKSMDDVIARKNINETVLLVRKNILLYLLEKKLISNELFDSQSNYKVKGV